MMYDFLCENCEATYVDTKFYRIGETHTERCHCGGRLLRGVVNVHIGPIMQEHFNAAVNQPISSMSKFRSELERKSDEMSERTGMDHHYVPVDLQEKKALGVTDEGLDATARVRREKGLDGPSARRIIY